MNHKPCRKSRLRLPLNCFTGNSLFETAATSLRFFGLTFAVVIFFNAGVFAQDTVTGAFQGNVGNILNDDPVAGAAVVITNEQTGVVYNLTTDSKGRFFQGHLTPGFYQISISIAGFKPRLLRREIKVSFPGEVVPVPVSLEPEPPPSPTATPAAAPALEPADNIRGEINTSDGRRDGSFKESEVTEIPLGSTTITRTFDELALFLPGVAPPPQTIGDVAGPGVGPGVGSAGQFAVNGLRSRANNFTVDGSDNNDEDIGVRRQGFVALVPQPIESIQEFQIITLLSPAQFGRNIGAQVNAVTKTGGNKFNGGVYGFFNSDRLNARNFFDTTSGSETFGLQSASGQQVLIDGQPLTVTNQSGDEDSFTFGQFGGTLGGAIVPNRLFYFFSGEYQKINASQEKSFAVPTVEQRGPFGTGATGIATNFFTGATLQNPLFPVNERGNAVFSLFPFANNPDGVYGENTFTQVLPASGRGVILSGRLDHSFALGGRPQSLTGKLNITDDEKNIPAVNEAIFSTLLSKIQTQNLSIFFNSQLNRNESSRQLLNQVRFSFGRTHLNFEEVRDTEFLIPSGRLPDTPFLLNAPAVFNVSLPRFNGQPMFTRILPGGQFPDTFENIIGPVGQINMAGFSPLGVDVYNFPQDRTNKTYQIADELIWRVGQHAAIFGVDLRQTDLDSDLPRNARTQITFNGSPRLIPSGGAACGNGGIGAFCFPAANDPFRVIRPEDLAGLGSASNSLLTLNVDRPGSMANLRYYQMNFYGQDTWRILPELSLSFGLRYEYNTPVKERNGLIEDTFSDDRLSLLPVLDGLVNDRTQLYEPDRNNFAPRLGIAYSPELFGRGRPSVFRAGYGLFYDQILGAVANQSRNVFPTFLTLNFGGLNSFPNQQLSIFNPANATISGVPVVVPGTANTFNAAGFTARQITFANFVSGTSFLFPNAINVTLPTETLEMPMAHHYTFSFEQQLNSNFTVSAAYVGTTGRNLLRFTTPNLGSSLTVVPTGFTTSSFSSVPRPFGNVFIPSRPFDVPRPGGGIDSLGAVNQFETTGESTYNSLQTELRGRFIDRFDFRVSYTFSKVTDLVSDVFDLAGAYVLPQDSFDLEAERGPANFDVRHRLAYSMIYSFAKNSGGLKFLTDNLQIATTGRFHSGQPFTVNSVIDVNLDGNQTDRLDTTDGIEETGDRNQPLRLTTTNTASLLAPFGQNGSIGRNSFRAGNVAELDLGLTKRIFFGERNLSLRADFFNFINRANFGVPVRLLEAPGFGKATSTVTPARRIQLSLKYEF